MKMKRTRIIAGLVALSIVALASFASLVAATIAIPSIAVSANGNVWQINAASWGFSGNDVDKESVQAYFFINVGDEPTYVTPSHVILNNKFITLVFEPSDDLPIEALANGVIGSVGSDNFIATGPGWAFRQG